MGSSVTVKVGYSNLMAGDVHLNGSTYHSKQASDLQATINDVRDTKFQSKVSWHRAGRIKTQGTEAQLPIETIVNSLGNTHQLKTFDLVDCSLLLGQLCLSHLRSAVLGTR